MLTWLTEGREMYNVDCIEVSGLFVYMRVGVYSFIESGVSVLLLHPLSCRRVGYIFFPNKVKLVLVPL